MHKRLACRLLGHKRDPRAAWCDRCHLTDEEAERMRGREKPPTWDDVDAARQQGWDDGMAYANIMVRRSRRRYVKLGLWLMLRRLEHSIAKPRDADVRDAA